MLEILQETPYTKNHGWLFNRLLTKQRFQRNEAGNFDFPNKGEIVESVVIFIRLKRSCSLLFPERDNWATGSLTPTQEKYAMVGPSITKDNFILIGSQGHRRMDVGDSEGQRMSLVVQMIVEDGGTLWHIESGYRNYWVISFSTGLKNPSHQSLPPVGYYSNFPPRSSCPVKRHFLK
jgi:hypothetical protein